MIILYAGVSFIKSLSSERILELIIHLNDPYVFHIKTIFTNLQYGSGYSVTAAGWNNFSDYTDEQK